MRILVNVMAVTLTLAVIAVTADLFRKVGLSLYTEQYLAGLMALAMPLLYLHVPAQGRRGTRGGPVPWYDLVAAAVSFAAMVYVAVRFPSLSELVSARPWDGLIVAGIVIAAHPRGPPAHHRERAALHHHVLLRARPGRRLPAGRVRRQVDSVRPPHLLFGMGLPPPSWA